MSEVLCILSLNYCLNEELQPGRQDNLYLDCPWCRGWYQIASVASWKVSEWALQKDLVSVDIRKPQTILSKYFISGRIIMSSWVLVQVFTVAIAKALASTVEEWRWSKWWKIFLLLISAAHFRFIVFIFVFVFILHRPPLYCLPHQLPDLHFGLDAIHLILPLPLHLHRYAPRRPHQLDSHCHPVTACCCLLLSGLSTKRNDLNDHWSQGGKVKYLPDILYMAVGTCKTARSLIFMAIHGCYFEPGGLNFRVHFARQSINSLTWYLLDLNRQADNHRLLGYFILCKAWRISCVARSLHARIQHLKDIWTHLLSHLWSLHHIPPDIFPCSVLLSSCLWLAHCHHRLRHSTNKKGASVKRLPVCSFSPKHLKSWNQAKSARSFQPVAWEGQTWSLAYSLLTISGK